LNTYIEDNKRDILHKSRLDDFICVKKRGDEVKHQDPVVNISKILI